MVDYADDGSVTFLFTMPITEDDGIQTDKGKFTNFIYAIGPPVLLDTIAAVNGSISLPMHTEVGVASISLMDGSVSSNTDTALRSLQVMVHAVLMTLAFLILTPMAIFFASPTYRERLFPNNRSSNPRYTAPHRNVMILVMILAGVAFYMGWFVIGSRSFMAHFLIGTTVAFLLLIQCVSGVWRMTINTKKPRKKNAGFFRKFGAENVAYFVLVHTWIGRLAWVLAAVNVFFGIEAFSEFGLPHIIAALVLTAIGALLVMAGSLFGMSSVKIVSAEAADTQQSLDAMHNSTEKTVEVVQEPENAHVSV